MKITPISSEALADLIEATEIIDTSNTGSTIFLWGYHSEHGAVLLLNDAASQCVMITV